MRLLQGPRHHVTQPIRHPSRYRIHRRVWAIHTDPLPRQAEERGLLRVCESEGFEASEYDWVVGDDDAVFVLDGFGGDGAGEVYGEEDGVVLAVEGVEGCFEEDWSGCWYVL